MSDLIGSRWRDAYVPAREYEIVASDARHDDLYYLFDFELGVVHRATISWSHMGHLLSPKSGLRAIVPIRDPRPREITSSRDPVEETLR